MKKVIYNAIIGDYDELHKPTVITPGWDYICFTNNPKLKSKYWKIRVIKDLFKVGNQKFSRSFWVLNHHYVNEYDLSITTGGQIWPCCNLDEFVSEFLPCDENVDMAMHDRGIRKGIYDEASACKRKGKADKKIIDKQMKFYRKEGLPEDTGIFSTGIIIRKHHRSNVEEHCEKWWEQIKMWTHRDQLSFNYVLWKYNLVNISSFHRDVLRGKGNLFQKRKHKRYKK